MYCCHSIALYACTGDINAMLFVIFKRALTHLNEFIQEEYERFYNAQSSSAQARSLYYTQERIGDVY